MKRLFLILLLALAVTTYGQYDPYTTTGWDAPYAFTGDSLASPSWTSSYGYYGLGIMTLNSNPGGWLNYNYWKIDSLMQSLVVYTDSSQLIVRNDTLMLADYIAAAIDSQYSPFWLDFSPTHPDSVPYKEGRLFYDSLNNSMDVYIDEPDVTHNLGRELYVRVYNATAGQISNGMPVYVSGVHNGTPEASPAQADIDMTSNIAGIATHDIDVSSYGYVTRFGNISDVNTVGLITAKPYYLSDTVPGGITATKPDAPSNVVFLGIALEIGASGNLFTAIDKFDFVNGVAYLGFEDSSSTLTTALNVPARITNTWGTLFTYDVNVGHDITLSGDTVFVAEAGVYHIGTSFSFEGGVSGIYKFQIHQDGVAVSNSAVRRKTASADVGSIAFNTTVRLDAGEYVTFWVTNVNNSTNLTVVDGTVSISQVR